jgi:hypothetical protein
LRPRILLPLAAAALLATALPALAAFLGPEADLLSPTQGAFVFAAGAPPPTQLAYVVHIQNLTSFEVTLRDATGTTAYGTDTVTDNCATHADVPGNVPYGTIPRPFLGTVMVRVVGTDCFGGTLVDQHTFTLFLV